MQHVFEEGVVPKRCWRDLIPLATFNISYLFGSKTKRDFTLLGISIGSFIVVVNHFYS